MSTQIINKEHLEKLPLEFNAWQYLSTEKISLLELHLKPGEEIPSHQNPLDVVFYVINGQGNVTIEGETLEAKTGDCIPISKNFDRGWLNPSNMELILLVIKIA